MEEIDKKINEIEERMNEADFWLDKEKAQAFIKELQDLKAEKEQGPGVGPYDKGSAIMTIFSGAGGDDSEDFSRILVEMYKKYIEKKGWSIYLLHQNENNHGGF